MLRGQLEAPDERLGFPAGGAVADGDGLDLEPLAQGRDLDGVRRGRALDVVQVDHVVVLQLSLPVQAHDLASRAKARVQGQDVLAAQGRGQQQLPQVVGKDPDRLLVGPFLGLHEDLGFHRGGHEPLVAVEGGLADQDRAGRLPFDEQDFESSRRFVLGRHHLHSQKLLPAPLRMARILCEGALATGSSHSK